MSKVAIIGLGRIGKVVFKKLLDNHEIVLVSDINPNISNHRYLLQYDSTYGRYSKKIESNENGLKIEGKTIPFIQSSSISDINWKDYDVDIIIDSSGAPKNEKLLREVTKLNDSKAIITKSSKYVDKEIVFGLNHNQIKPEDKVFSSSICDANALAHVINFIYEAYGISAGHFISLHPWLAFQNLVDGSMFSIDEESQPWKEFSYGRASPDSLIPKNTTAVTACEKVLPNIEGIISSFSYRTPLNTVTSGNLQVVLKEAPSQIEFYNALKENFNDGNLFSFEEEDLVSIDYKGTDFSCAIYSKSIKVVENLASLSFWYDNEWGYSQRVVDLAEYISEI